MRNWIEAERLWDGVCARVPLERRHEVRYEELLADPERVLSGVCRFLGVPYDADMLSYPADTSYDAPDPSLAFQWKRKLTSSQIRLVESRVGDLLSNRGYEPSGLPQLSVGFIRRGMLHLQDRMARSIYRLRRFGPALTIAHAVSSRIGPTSWHRSCVDRINAIKRSQLK